MAARDDIGVYDITPFTQLDFPGELACIVWFAGCNLRCAYCHNPEMVRSVGEKPWQEVLAFLEGRRNKLGGVVFSGGEATLHPHIVRFGRDVKALGYRLKLDTNGTRPKVLKALLDENLLDMVAMDYKAPRNKFRKVTRMRESLWDNFQKSLRMMVAGSVPFEVRTTVHTDLLDVADVAQMHADLEACGYRGSYHVQNYRHGPTLGDMARQDAVLQVAALPVGQKVRVEFRNF